MAARRERLPLASLDFSRSRRRRLLDDRQGRRPLGGSAWPLPSPALAQLEELFALLETRSRMIVFRRLREVGYHTSYTHTGRYYTLADVPRFDTRGLWFAEEIGFSAHGTLKSTVAVLVPASPAGMTHAEMRTLLTVRVLNTLHDLLAAGRVGARRLGRARLYVSPQEEEADRQLAARRERSSRATPHEPALAEETTLEVLVEAVWAARVVVDAKTLAARLEARGVVTSVAQVRDVCARHGVELERETRSST